MVILSQNFNGGITQRLIYEHVKRYSSTSVLKYSFTTKRVHGRLSGVRKKHLHWPGIEPGPPAWQARILPLNHQCLNEFFFEFHEYLVNYSMKQESCRYFALIAQTIPFMRMLCT